MKPANVKNHTKVRRFYCIHKVDYNWSFNFRNGYNAASPVKTGLMLADINKRNEKEVVDGKGKEGQDRRMVESWNRMKGYETDKYDRECGGRHMFWSR